MIDSWECHCTGAEGFPLVVFKDDHKAEVARLRIALDLIASNNAENPRETAHDALYGERLIPNSGAEHE